MQTRSTVSLDRLAATEYALWADPRHTRPGRFGSIVAHPDFRWRSTFNALFNVRCESSDVSGVFAEVAELAAAAGLDYEHLRFHDPATRERLTQAVASKPDWHVGSAYILTARGESLGAEKEVPGLEIRSVPLGDFAGDRLEVFRESKWPLVGYVCRQSQDLRLGGKAFVAYVDGKPAGRRGITSWMASPASAPSTPIRASSAEAWRAPSCGM